MEMERVIVDVKIDDDVIRNSDPQTILDPVFWLVNIYDGEQKYRESMSRFSLEQGCLLAIIWYVAEVDNGGHDQFYYNSTGIVWKDALAGFSMLGLEEAVKILEESAARMGGNPSLDRATRQSHLHAYAPDFEDLDDRLYILEENDFIWKAMQEYIRGHASAFYFDGKVPKYVQKR